MGEGFAATQMGGGGSLLWEGGCGAVWWLIVLAVTIQIKV